LDCGFASGNYVYVDPATNENTVICVDGKDHYGEPTYIWNTSETGNKTFVKLWHATIGMIDHGTGGHLQGGVRKIETIAPSQVYKVMPIQWSIEASLGYGNPWRSSYAASFENVTNTEGISLTT